jgi:uncharacterized repeat protein (TIGR03803 family)
MGPVGLTEASDGNFYGTTSGGGTSGFGVVFRMTPSGTVTTLYQFSGPDGSNPDANLVQGNDGFLYGTTASGGTYSWGTVFKINFRGSLTTLHSFNYTDGAQPGGGLSSLALFAADDGNIYGTTNAGGKHNCATGCGTVFQITPGGALTTLHGFHFTDGGSPGGVIQGTDGSLYGTTSEAGMVANGPSKYQCGTIFKVTRAGAFTTLHNFNAASDGDSPGALVQGTDGNFYGVTYSGGSSGNGTMFSLSVGLGPFVRTVLHEGKIGSSVIILGNDLTGATSVTFNGTPAAFTVVSATEITTTVPSGATTGLVRVTTPGGTLISSGKFQVLP